VARATRRPPVIVLAQAVLPFPVVAALTASAVERAELERRLGAAR
jgi:hypothetical protein